MFVIQKASYLMQIRVGSLFDAVQVHLMQDSISLVIDAVWRKFTILCGVFRLKINAVLFNFIM